MSSKVVPIDEEDYDYDDEVEVVPSDGSGKKKKKKAPGVAAPPLPHHASFSLSMKR